MRSSSNPTQEWNFSNWRQQDFTCAAEIRARFGSLPHHNLRRGRHEPKAAMLPAHTQLRGTPKPDPDWSTAKQTRRPAEAERSLPQDRQLEFLGYLLSPLALTGNRQIKVDFQNFRPEVTTKWPRLSFSVTRYPPGTSTVSAVTCATAFDTHSHTQFLCLII